MLLFYIYIYSFSRRFYWKWLKKEKYFFLIFKDSKNPKYHGFHKILSRTTIFNIDINKNFFLISKSAY